MAINVPQLLPMYSKGNKKEIPNAIALLKYFVAYQQIPKRRAIKGHNTNTTNIGFTFSNNQ